MKLEGTPIRREVLIFAALMERKLRQHDAAKGAQGWKNDSPSDLLERVHEELSELDCIHEESGGRPTDTAPLAAEEAVDVANMLMMYVDQIEQLPPPGTELIGYEEPLPPIDKPIDWFDVSMEQFSFAREISDLTGIRPRLFCDLHSSPKRRGRFRVDFDFMDNGMRIKRAIEGVELVVLLRTAVRDVRAARRS